MAVEDPATGQVFPEVPRSNGEDVKDAVAVARRAFGEWSPLSERERASILLRSTVILRQQLSTLSEWEVHDSGKHLKDARANIEKAAYLFEYYGG